MEGPGIEGRLTKSDLRGVRRKEQTFSSNA
jgi:hypothetical protein